MDLINNELCIYSDRDNFIERIRSDPDSPIARPDKLSIFKTINRVSFIIKFLTLFIGKPRFKFNALCILVKFHNRY